MQVRWGEGFLIGVWLAGWLAALWWGGVSDTAGLLIPILAAGAIPRIFRQLFPLSPRLRPAPPPRRALGRVVAAAGLVLVLGGIFLQPSMLPVMSHMVAAEEVGAFRAAWAAEHGAPVTAAEQEAERAALDRFTEAHVRQRVLTHEDEATLEDAARRLGMFGGAALVVCGLVLGTGRPRRQRRRQHLRQAVGRTQPAPVDRRRRHRRQTGRT